ncbi:Peptide chain release factor subunit 1 [uncultured archaeon]|nr:Peptide chain release factor subunit 1 [uncultured archaeon]
MFDLFKKDELDALKARIAEIEKENRRLSLLLEKKDEKTKKTVATKQEADRELNEARAKISSLTNEMQKLKKETFTGPNYRFSESLSRNRLDEVLFLLGSVQSRTSTLITVYLAWNDDLKSVSPDILTHIDSNTQYLIEKIESPTGKAIFYDTNQIVKLVMLPVFPLSHTGYSFNRRFDIEPLEKSLRGDKTLVIDTHAGETFIGIMEADTFVEHEVVRSSVMGKHSKGGWSQKRFQSLVEEDVKHHADKVRAALYPMIGKHKDTQQVIAGGEGKLIKMILEGYDYPVIIKSMDAIGKGNVDQVLREVMSVRWYGI